MLGTIVPTQVETEGDKGGMMQAILTRAGEICPYCQANRTLLREMLQEIEPLETENHAIARVIIGNCSACTEALRPKKGEEER